MHTDTPHPTNCFTWTLKSCESNILTITPPGHTATKVVS